MISVGELAQLRTDFVFWQTETANVQRTARTPDGKGGYVNSASTVYNGTVDRKPATETRGSVAEVPVGDRAGALSYWLFSFPAGTDIRPQDVITVEDRTYQVAGPALDKSIELQRYVMAVETV